MGSTTELRRALKARFFSHAESSGFAVDSSRQPVTTTFRRRVGSAVQIFDVQWDKYGRPRFILHFGTCPAQGLPVDGAICAPETVFATWCPDRGSLQPRRGTSTRSWFRQDA